MEFRCPSRLHLVADGDAIEVKCKSKHCGAGNGTIVIHKFHRTTGELIETRTFKEPSTLFITGRGGKEDARTQHTAAVRTP